MKDDLGPYVLVVTERKLACKFLGHYIWQVKGTEVLPCSRNMDHLNGQQRADEEQYIQLIKSFLASDWLYYSTTYDLTRSVQSQVLPKSTEGLLKADIRFVVNRYIAQPFLKVLEERTDTRLDDFLVFCIEGCMEIVTLV